MRSLIKSLCCCGWRAFAMILTSEKTCDKVKAACRYTRQPAIYYLYDKMINLISKLN